MKQKVRVSLDGKIVEGEFNTRNTLHLEVQQRNRAQVFTPKKGKGSFKRNKRVIED